MKEGTERSSEAAMGRVRRALSKTKNKSAPGPDGISWRLLKMIKDFLAPRSFQIKTNRIIGKAT